MIQIVKLKSGKYFNRVKAPNGATLMKSEHFKSLQAAKKNIESLRTQIWLEPKMVTQ